jgi:rubrerythrin
MRNFSDLTEREILALAIANEEEDGRIYLDIAEGLRTDYPGSANVFTEMAGEEGDHRRRLLDVYREKFGEHIPLIRRQDVRGFIQHKPVWQMYPMNLKAVRSLAENMETETQGFYRRAAARSEDVTIRKLLGDLADAEVEHEHRADQLVEENLPANVRRDEDAHARQSFVLRVIQPGLAGLMDGSVSTLAPVFAAAFASNNTWETFLVGLAASVGAGISMGFAEALVDDHGRRNRPHAAIPDPVVLDRDGGGDLRRDRGTGCDFLDPMEIHGHPAAVRDASGGVRRRAGVRRRDPDRQQLTLRQFIRARRANTDGVICSADRNGSLDFGATGSGVVFGATGSSVAM